MPGKFRKVQVHSQKPAPIIVDGEYRKITSAEIIQIKNCLTDVSLRTNQAAAIERAWGILNAVEERA